MLAPPQPNRNMSTLNCEYYITQQTESSTCQRYWLNTYIKVTWFHQQTQITVGKYIVHTQHTRRSEIPINIIKANMKPHLIPDLTNHFKQWYSDNACTVHNRKINCQQCSLKKWIFPVNRKKNLLHWYDTWMMYLFGDFFESLCFFLHQLLSQLSGFGLLLFMPLSRLCRGSVV